MRHLAMLIGISAASLILGVAPTAQAANPEVNHYRESGTINDPSLSDFCGTGQTVDGTFSGNVVEFLAPNGDVDYVRIDSGTVTLTNPETGATVLVHTVQRFTDDGVSGDPAGINTHETTYTGLSEQLRLENGRVLSVDAGTITFRDTFNGGEFLFGEITISHGPHPDAETDFALFCEITTAALGL
jgi:hypothetical protein